MTVAVSRSRRTLLLCWTMLALSVAAGSLLAYLARPGQIAPFPGLQALRAPDAASLAEQMKAFGLLQVALGGDRAAVPRLGLVYIPDGWTGIADVNQRKALFLGATLPLVLAANDAIIAERKKLKALKNNAASLSKSDRIWLAELAARYRSSPDDLDRLLIRVDTIPPSLALAQAAIESGWGTSRFARQGNALFGQWTWKEGAGLKPKRMRQSLGSYAIKRYDSLYASVADYMRNLNTQKAYAAFRRQRAALRARGQWPNGKAVAATLRNYSEEGEVYVAKLAAMIRTNRLAPFDTARLAR